MGKKVKSTSWTYDSLSKSHMNLWRLLAVMPFKNRDLSSTGTRVLFVYFNLINTFYITSYTGYGVRMVLRRSFEIDYICEEVIVQCLSIRYWMLLFKRPQLLGLMESCRKLWDNLVEGEDRTVKEFEKRVHYYRNFFLWNSYIVTLLFIVSVQFVRLPPATVNGTERRVLPFKFYVDVQEEPAFTIVVFATGYMCCNTALILTGLETLAPFLIMMACGYLRTIQNRLMNMTSSDSKDKLCYDEVLKCAKFHQDVMILDAKPRFCEDVERFMRSLFMVSIIGSVYNVSLIGLQLIDNVAYIYKYASLLVLNFMQLFICQWAPEQLLQESESIGIAAYSATLSHREYETRVNKALMLMMLRAQKPVQMTAGGYINLSIENFGHMITNALSFFTVARNFG